MTMMNDEHEYPKQYSYSCDEKKKQTNIIIRDENELKIYDNIIAIINHYKFIVIIYTSGLI